MCSPKSAAEWRLALQMADDAGSIYDGVAVTPVELPSGAADVLFGFRLQGSGYALVTDIVSGASVVASQGNDIGKHGGHGYDNGVARIGLGTIEFWGAEAGSPNEPHAGWSLERHDVLQFDGQLWRLSSSTTKPRGDRIGPATGRWPS
jgi:hypothetical protein